MAPRSMGQALTEGEIVEVILGTVGQECASILIVAQESDGGEFPTRLAQYHNPHDWKLTCWHCEKQDHWAQSCSQSASGV